MSEQVVGRVVGTEDSTPLTFQVALTPGAFLQLDDVVIAQRDLPDGESLTVSGLVTQLTARHEGPQYASDVFLVMDGVLPAGTVEVAEITTSRVDPEIYAPLLPGAEVRRAVKAEREHALFFDQMRKKIPIGLGRDGEPLFANLEFIDGTRGAHINISGISGVATKTSYATFLLYSIFSCGELGPEAANTKALIFNVKGEDLLFLDQPNIHVDEEVQDAYRTLGLIPGPFPSVGVFAPPARNDPNAGPDVRTRTTNVRSFYWTIADFVEEELLPFVFADAEDERQQYTMVIHNVARCLADGERVGDDGAWRIDDVTITTYRELIDLIVQRLTDDMTQLQWAGRAVGMGTINAFIRRLMSSQRTLSHLVRADIPLRQERHVRTSDAQVTVVDLHNLADRAQRFVVGVTVQRALQQKEASGTPRPLLFIVLDELNKYAPREGTSPIKEILLDIAERGRSLGMVLVGAQQTASEVERRIISNSSIRVAGRLDPAEAGRPEYGFLPAAHRDRARIAKPGTMFVSQPEIPIPLVAAFPFPAWATRPDEVAMSGPEDDPFDGFPGGRG